ncbi:chromate transporter [Mobilisporobacter senegalensis]|uniref:Chromate transporter n=1 Tax=Mobilisporobacter senegalensis TaxID=1329262 RepID=A0A3N1XUT9_9FIRM|nr:chromate transporter [Mobilisporobacter senegalensis]ROR30395.1 chromate transporter [Mobilisporobacter senegalensis]
MELEKDIELQSDIGEKEVETHKRTDAKKEHRGKLLITLFLNTLYISTFTFGGGFVIITFMKRKFVDDLKWINEQEMLDMSALAQSSPGAIAVNAAILIGWKICGFPGMIVAVIGTILPPMVILAVLSFFYTAFAGNGYVALLLKGMQAGVAAVILDVVWGLGGNVIKERSKLSIIIMLTGFVAAFVFDINVIYIILAASMIGICKAILPRRQGVKS